MSDSKHIRQTILKEIGEQGQEVIGRVRVLIVGAGGLGCPVIQYLAAAGVGQMTIIDYDRVEVHNLHRQTIFGEGDVGESKAEVAANFVRDRHPDVSVDGLIAPLSDQNAMALVSTHDLIIDGSDNFTTRYLVNDACEVMDKPFISGALYRWEGQVGLFNYFGSPTYRDLYPSPPQAASVPNCAETGIVGALAGIVGNVMALEAIKAMVGAKPNLAGKHWIYDGLSHVSRTIAYERRPDREPILAVVPIEEVQLCSANDILKYGVIPEGDDILRLNVSAHGLVSNGWTHIPLALLAEELPRIEAKRIVIDCPSGHDSMTAARMIKAFAPEKEVGVVAR